MQSLLEACLQIHCCDCLIFEIVMFLCFYFYLPLGVSLMMLQLILIQGLWLTGKGLHVFLWDSPQQMQGSARVHGSKLSTSCVAVGPAHEQLQVTSVLSLFALWFILYLWNSQVLLKWCWLGLLFFQLVCIYSLLHCFPCLHSHWSQHLMAFGTLVVSCPKLCGSHSMMYHRLKISTSISF